MCTPRKKVLGAYLKQTKRVCIQVNVLSKTHPKDDTKYMLDGIKTCVQLLS